MSKAYQQVHKNCGGIIVLMGQNGNAFLMCRKCFEQWHPQIGLSIAVSKDFENPPRELCETIDKGSFITEPKSELDICPFCNGTGLVEDQNWQPDWPGQIREEGNGIMFCGGCQ